MLPCRLAMPVRYGLATIVAAATFCTSGGQAHAQAIELQGSVTPNSTSTTNWTISGDFNVGVTGSGSLIIRDGATIQDSSGTVGYGANATGTATVSGPGTSWNNSSRLDVGVFGNGTLTIEGGGKTTAVFSAVGNRRDSQGTVVVRGTGSKWTDTGGFSIGREGFGTFIIEQGATASSAYVNLGEFSRATGIATVTGHGSVWEIEREIHIGRGGIGKLLVDDGGRVNSAIGLIGYSDSSRYNGLGSATISGVGSTFASSNTIEIGSGSASNGILTIQNAGTVTSGALQGDGRHNGTVTLATAATAKGTLNIGAAADQAAAGAGTLDAVRLAFGPGNGTLVFNHTSNDYDFFTVLSGNGTVRQLAGATTLSADSSAFTGTTTISGGSLFLAGNAHLGGDIVVNGHGLLGGIGTAGSTGRSVTIESGGVLSPGLAGNSADTLHIAGDLLLKNGSVYAVDLSTAGDDRVSVAGTATIESNKSVRVKALDANINYNTPQIHMVLSAAGGVTGAFSDTWNLTAFLDSSLTVDNSGRDLMLQIGVGRTFSSVATTPSARAIAATLDSLGHSSGSLAFYNSLLMLSPDEVDETFRQLSGELHATQSSSLVTTTMALNDLINQRIQGQSGDPLASQQITPLGYAEEDKSASATGPFASFEAKAAPDGFDAERLAVWTSGFGSWGRIDGTDGGARVSNRSGGVVVGADSLVADVWRLGLFGGYSSASSRTVDAAADSDNYHLGAYAGREWGALALRSGINYTWSDIDTVRSVTALNQTLSANHDAGALNLFGELAYRMTAGEVAFEPFVNLAHARVRSGGFTETGGAAALTVAGSTTDTTFTTIGLRTGSAFDLGGTVARVHGTLGWQHAFGDTLASSTARFATGDSFTIFSKPLDKDALVLQGGLDFGLSPSATLGISYNGRIGANAREHGASARLRVAF